MSLIKCLKKFGKGLSASDREALRNKFNEYQNAGFDNFKASMFALEDYHTQISNALNNLKSAVNIKQTDSTKPALLSFHQQGEDLTDFLTKLKTGGYSGVEVIRAKNEIQSLFEKPAQQEVKPESATKQETAYYNKKSGRQLIDEATPEQIAEALKLRESDPLEFYSRTFFHNLQEGDSFNIGQNEFLVKKGKGDARLIIQKTDINKKTTNISIFESPYGRYGTKGKDDAKFNQLARDIESQINFELTDNSDDLFSFVSHPTTKPFLDIAKRNEQHLLSKETKTTKQEQLEGLDLAEKYNIYPKESVESLYSRDNVPLSDILDAAIGYDDAYERINEIDNEIKGLDKKRDKQKIKALETEKHQIQWLVQSAQDAWGEDLLNKLFDIAEQSGFEVDREADRDLFAEFAMPYLTDGRYMENAYHKVNLRTYTNDLIGEFFATQEGERAFGVKAYEALQQVVDTEKNLPKSKEIAQAILDLSRDFGKVEAGEMVATDLIQVLNVVFSAENLSQPLNDARKQDNLTPPQREFYRWILEGTFKENLADIIKALQNEDVEYAPEQIQEPIVTEQNFTIYDIAKAIYQHFVGGGSFENINQARSFVQQLIGRKIEPGTNDAKMVDEVVELGVVLRAKQIAQSDLSVAEKYQALVNLYEKQPNLSVRTSTSTKNQAYSTPAPLAYIVSRLANINNLARVYEPSAGNGMLLMEANPTKAVVNELNSDRADNLISQGFRVSEMDAATKENPSEPFDVIIGNPPFGTVKNEYGVTSEWHIGGPYRTSQIDHAIIFQALKGLRQNGRAVFLLGGPSKIDTDEQRVSGYQTQAKRSFFHWLTTHYNLVDHFTIDGNLYKKQGAGFPIDVIVVRNDLRPGQKSTLGMPQANLPKIYRSWEDLAEKIGEQNETDFNGAIRTDGIGGQTNQLDAAGNLGTTAVGSDLGSTQSNTQPTTLFDLLSGQGSSNDSVGRRPGSGTRKPRRKTPRSESAGTDYSDSSEFGNDRTGDRGTSGGIRSDGGNAVTNAGQVQSSGSSNVSGNESGRLDGSTTNLDAVKEQNPDLTDDVIKGWTEAASDIFNILDDDTLLSIEDEKQPQTETQQNFSEKKYQALLPKFEQIWNAVKNEITNIQDGFKRFARFLVQSMKATREQILALRPYIARFTVEKGRELTLQNQKKLRVKHIRPEFTPEQLAGASQIPWLPQSKGNPMGTLIPANQYNSVVNALESLEEKVGDIDNYVAEKLNYLDENGKIPDEFFDKFFGGEQIDALALAIYNIENGAGFIIGDQTGIGKGRVVAGVMKYALLNDHIPVFVTEKANLYKDIYRDLIAIGMNPTDIKPLMTDSQKLIPLTDYAIDTIQLHGNANPRSRHIRHLLNSGEILMSPEAKDHNPILRQIAENGGELPSDYNIVFATYYAFQSKKGETPKREFLKSIADKSIFIFDESHNAGGDGTTPRPRSDGSMPPPNRAQFARNLVEMARGVFYSSATWAKRPDVMSLYSKTDMRLAVNGDVNVLGGTIERGGVPLQQVVSAMLAETGQYMRRERDFDGINYDTTEAVIDKKLAENVSAVFRAVFEMSKYLEQEVIPEIGDDLMESAHVIRPGLGIDSNMVSNGFANVMHNAIAQMLLALKVKPAVEEALRDLRSTDENGRKKKVVLTVANTMGSLIAEYAEIHKLNPGDAIDLTFGNVLRRYLEKSRTVSIGAPNAGSERVTVPIPDSLITDEGMRLYNKAIATIEKYDWSQLPGSPIDWMISELEKEGFKVGEITGRSQAMMYNPDGSAIYRRRVQNEISIKGRNETIKGFNSGAIDVIILNQAGATGLSLHAAKEFSDQGQRVMILVQPEANIDTHMQMLGRVNRTGQIIVPHYKQLTADIPAEKRPAANLAMKMAKLNANTTASTDSAVTAKDTLDFLNKYGNEVVAQFLEDNRDVADRLGNPLREEDNGLTRQDAARKVTGRLPILTLAEQEDFFNNVSDIYNAMITQLKSIGEYDLEAQTFPLEAKTITRRKIFAGPGGSESPFAGDAYAEEVESKKLSRPRSSAEVTQILQDALQLDDSADNTQIKEKGWQTTMSLYNDWGKAIQEYIDSQMEDAYEKADGDDRITDAIRTRLNGLRGRLERALRIMPIGSTVEVKIGNSTYYGVVSAVRKMNRAKTPLALSDYQFTVLTTDASRQLIIPASQIYTEDHPAPSGNANAATIKQSQVQPGFMGISENIWNAFDNNSRTVTERRTIITGNLLAGYASFSAGKILYYTTDAGEIRQGILMPQDFNIEKELQEQPVRFTEGGQVREFLEGGNRVVNSLDGDIFISNYNNAFSVAVPSSRAKGAVYYQNQQLLDAANGVQFVSSGKNMYLRLKTDGQALEAVVNQLMNMGVKFETATFRDVARNIVGQQLPEVEVMQSESFELQQEIAEREKELAEARAKFTAEKFNHTQSGKEVFVARPKNSRDASDYSVRRLASQHNGYYSSFNKDGAIAGFHFKNAEDRDAFIQSTSETENMLSVEDNEELKRQEAIRTVKTVPLAQVAVKTQAVRVGNRVKLNIAAMEMLRRAMEQVDIDEGKRDFREKTPYPAFLGMSPDVLKLHKAIAVLEKIAAQAEKREMHDVAKSLRDLAQTLKEATKKGQRGSTVLYVIDKKLPHELLHQALKIGSGWKIFDEQHTAEGRTKLDNSAQFKKADDFFFSKKPEYSIESYMAKGYSRLQAMQIRRGVIREEIAAWIAEGSWENIGLSKEEGFNYLLDFLQSFGQKVYNDNIDLGKTPQQALEAQNEAFQNFNEVDYAREIINYFHSRTNTTESGQVGRPDEASPGTAQGEQGGADEETGSDVSGYEPKTIVRPKGDASELEYPNQFPGVLKKYGLASLPGTQRAVGIAADNIVYTVFSDKAAQKEAQKLIQTLGVAGTLNLLLDDTALPNPDVHHAVAAFTLQKMLADESVRIQETNPEDAQKLMDIATNLGQKMALRMTKAGRFIRAASVIMKNVPGILATATSLYQQQHGIHADLPEAIKQRVQRIAEKSESDAVQAESLQKQLDILTAEVEKWKKELQLLQKGQGKNSRNNFVSRRKLVEAVKQRHKAEVGRALANLQNFTMNKPFPTVNFEGNTETTLLSIADNELPKEILQDFVKVGADLMVTGLAQSETMTPSEFKEQMISMFGNTIEPHLEQLHRESLTLRNRWLAEMNKEQKVKAIVREIGDDLSDEDIEAILQDDADKLYKRQAIVRLHHYLAYNSSKQKDISTLEEIIYGLAPNEITAFAASALVYYQPSAQEVYRLLEQESVTGAEAREVLREAVKIKERAEGIHKSKIENEKEIRREKISNGQQELEELKTLTSQAKRRSAESRLEIEKEFKRIGSNSYKIPKTEILIEPGYYWNIAKELYHTPWSLMTAGDLSGLGRQGGFLLIGRGMVNNLTNLFRKASGTLEKKGKATSQKGALVAFKNSARMEGQWMNDYLPQIVKNKFDQLAQRIGQIGFERTVEELEQHPYFELARQSEVDFALLGRLNEHSILKGEESLRANIFKMLADTTKDSKWHLVNPARAFSGLIEKSDEVYSLFLDAQRLLTFAQSAEMLMRDNYTNIETAPKEFKAIGHYINDATGRSYIGNKDSRLTNLIVNAPFGAPRYLISRFKLLYKSTLGLALPGLGWKARGIIAKDAAAFYGTFGALAFLASLAGVGTTFDPDDDDFLKFKIGSNHLDILGGLQQVARPMFRLLKVGLRTYLKYPRENINLFSEEKNDKGEVVGRSAYVQEGISDVWNLDYGVIPTFIRRRLHPTFSLPIDYWTQKDAIGRPFNWTEALTSRFLPLGLNDFGKQIYNYSQGTEPFYNIPLAGIGLVGFGYTQYPDKAELTKTAAEKLAQKINGMRFDSGADDAAADTLRRKLSDLKTRARQGANIEPELTAMVANGEISTDTKERTLKQLNDTLFNQQIRSMPEDGLKLVRSVANPQEQQIIDELLNKRARKQQATAEKTAAKERLGLPATSPARTPSDQKPLGEQLKTSDVSEALVLWEMNKDKLSAEQKVEFRRVLKGKVLNSYQRDNLTRERYDAAKTILGDELKFQFREPVKKNKIVKPSVLD